MERKGRVMPLGPFELIIVLVIVVIFFGVGRLGEVGGALGKGIREFRRASDGAYDEDATADKDKTAKAEESA
jgi:sec-independent protein translocase protein TatA